MMEARLYRVERLLAALTRLMGAVRRQVETDGVCEDIVRDIIRKKLQQLG